MAILVLTAAVKLLVLILPPVVYGQQPENLNVNGTLTIKQGDKPASVTGNAILDSIITAVISGGVIVAIISGAYGYVSKKRDEKAAEISKAKENFLKISSEKITATSSMVPLYTACATYHNSLSAFVNYPRLKPVGFLLPRSELAYPLALDK